MVTSAFWVIRRRRMGHDANVTTPLHHHTEPVLTPAGIRSVEADAVLVFNPAVVGGPGSWRMVARVDLGIDGDPHIHGTSLVELSSSDGSTWAADRVLLDRAGAIRVLQPLEPHHDLEGSLWRVYDPRLQRLADGRLALHLAVDTTQGLRPALVVGDERGGLDDLRAVWMGQPDDRNHVLFEPDDPAGLHHRLTRPMHGYGEDALSAGRFPIHVSSSTDLEHWGSSRLVLAPRDLGPEVVKVGPGTPPIRTPAGWLSLVHGVRAVAADGPRGWEPDWRKRYDAWALLLDLEDPSRVIAVSDRPIWSAEREAERIGFRNDVVFPTAAVRRGDDVTFFAGAADTVVVRADASVADVVAWTLDNRR